MYCLCMLPDLGSDAVGPLARGPRELGSGAVGPWACGPMGWVCPAISDLVPWAQPQKIFGACGELLCVKDLVLCARGPGCGADTKKRSAPAASFFILRILYRLFFHS